MKWYPVTGIQDIEKPFITKTKIGENSICVVGYEGSLFAVSAICPHQGYDMSGGGWCENGKIICPLHGHSFDLQTGKGPDGYIKTFRVRVDDGNVFVGIRSVWDDIKQLFIK